jgi:hypothetical protein
MDEIQPLLGHVDEIRRSTNSPTVVFDPKGDVENPLEWSKAYKLGVVSLLGFMAFTTQVPHLRNFNFQFADINTAHLHA